MEEFMVKAKKNFYNKNRANQAESKQNSKKEQIFNNLQKESI
jgi:hypothetical protein